MFGSGASASTKFNRSQRLEKRSFKEISGSYSESNRVLKDKKLTPSQFERFKVELKEKRRRELFLTVLTLFIISFAVVSMLILVFR